MAKAVGKRQLPPPSTSAPLLDSTVRSNKAPSAISAVVEVGSRGARGLTPGYSTFVLQQK